MQGHDGVRLLWNWHGRGAAALYTACGFMHDPQEPRLRSCGK